MLVDRRQFVSFATANTVAAAIHPFEIAQNEKQGPPESSTVFAFQQVDVFSSRPVLGNPLAVVLGADALSDEQMAAFARAAITGNELLTNRPIFPQFGVAIPGRLGRDVLLQPDAKAVILLAGINDIGDVSTTADVLIAVDQQIILACHHAGLKIYGGTLTPFGGSNAIYGGNYGTPFGEQQRQKLNQWIRTSHAFDGVIDFDLALRDPANPTNLLPAYAGDPLHPNDAGYQVMGNLVDLGAILRDLSKDQ
jgi:hypothetical protein